MNIILAEDYRYPIGSFIEQVKKKFPPTSIVYCNARTAEDVLKKIKLPPVFSPSWLIISTARGLGDYFFTKPHSDRDYTVYVVRTEEESELLWRKFKSLGIDFKRIDNLHPSDSELMNYVIDNLGLKYRDAEFLINRVRKSPARLAQAVDILSTLPSVSKKDIERYVEPRTDLSFNRMFEYIIGQPPPVIPGQKWISQTKESKVFDLVKQYEYAPKFLMNFIVTRFEHYLLVYDKALLGLLDMANYKEFIKSNSEFEKVSEYTVKRALEALGHVSYGLLYNLYLLYKKELEEGARLIPFLTLLSLSKR